MRKAKKKSKTEEYKSGTDERDTDSSRYVTKGNVKPEVLFRDQERKVGAGRSREGEWKEREEERRRQRGRGERTGREKRDRRTTQQTSTQMECWKEDCKKEEK